MNLPEQINALVAKANDILDRAKSAGRGLTADEEREVETLTEKAKSIKDELAARPKPTARQLEVRKALGLDSDDYDDAHDGAARLDLSHLAGSIAEGMKSYSGKVRPGVKGLVPSGETVVTVPLVNTDPLAADVSHERAPRLVDVLPVTVRPAPVYSFLRQRVITSPGGATVVAPGDTKPTKKLGVTRVDAQLHVVAVLSEPQDKFLLEDASNLKTWVGAELSDAIQDALETEVLTGDGTGEHFTGLANTSGIQTQAYSTDRITTIAAGLARLTNLGIAPGFIALSAADALALQTSRNASGAFDLGGAIDPAASTAWGTRFVVVPGLAAGDAYVVGTETVALSTDGRGISVEWGTPGDTFNRNQVVARVEGRFNLDVTRPHGVVRLSLNEG